MPEGTKDKVKRPNGPPARSRARRASILQLEQYFTDQSRGPVDHAFMIAALQTHPGNRVHLMLVSPFIVETGDKLSTPSLGILYIVITFLEGKESFLLPGMVKRPRVRFPNLLGTVTTSSAAE